MTIEPTYRYGLIDIKDVKYGYLPWGKGKSLRGYRFTTDEEGTARLKRLEKEKGWFSLLVESVSKEGLRNPIFVISIQEGVYIRYGGSRFKACKKLNHNRVPAVIWDWVNRYKGFEELDNEKEIIQKYRDEPRVDFDDGQILHCSHYHLPGNPINAARIAHDKRRIFKMLREEKGEAATMGEYGPYLREIYGAPTEGT